MSRPYPDVSTAPAGGSSPLGFAGATSAQKLAAGFLASHADQFLEPLGLNGNLIDTLAVQEIITTPNKSEYQQRGTDYTVVYFQHHKGIPVFECSLSVAITQNGEVWSIVNRLRAVDPNLPAKPNLTADAALARARQALQDASVEPDAEGALFVWPPSHLAWRFNFLQPHFREIMIDAASGEVLLKRKNIRDDAAGSHGDPTSRSIARQVDLKTAKPQSVAAEAAKQPAAVSIARQVDLKTGKPASVAAEAAKQPAAVSTIQQVDLLTVKAKEVSQ
jgi:Zn-dependent metalloprotease